MGAALCDTYGIPLPPGWIGLSGLSYECFPRVGMVPFSGSTCSKSATTLPGLLRGLSSSLSPSPPQDRGRGPSGLICTAGLVASHFYCRVNRSSPVVEGSQRENKSMKQKSLLTEIFIKQEPQGIHFQIPNSTPVPDTSHLCYLSN